MATLVIQNGRIFIGSYDWSGQSNELALELSVADLDATVLGVSGQSTRIHRAGLIDGHLQAKGFLDFSGGATPGTDSIDNQNFVNLGVSDKPATVSEQFCAAGDIAHFLPVVALNAGWETAQVGQLLQFAVSARTRGRPVRGTVMVSPNASIAGSGSSTSRQLGAVLAAERVYGALHVIARTGTATLDAIVRSDAIAGMTTPITRLTFAQLSAPGSELLSAAGAITDDWWDVNYTIGGAGTVTFIVTVGIR